jgi:NTE family protein
MRSGRRDPETRDRGASVAATGAPLPGARARAPDVDANGRLVPAESGENGRSAAGGRARVPASRRGIAPQTVLAVASLGGFMAFVDATIVNIAFPDIERSFPHAGLSGLSWVLNAYNIVFAALVVAAGRIADLLGRKRAFRWGLVLFTSASGACAVAPSPLLLVVARIVQAVGAAVIVPCSLGLVLQAFPAERRTHAVALWTATAALAAGIGPSLGGVLVSASSWRLAFLVNLPIGAIAYWLTSEPHTVEVEGRNGFAGRV